MREWGRRDKQNISNTVVLALNLDNLGYKNVLDGRFCLLSMHILQYNTMQGRPAPEDLTSDYSHSQTNNPQSNVLKINIHAPKLTVALLHIWTGLCLLHPCIIWYSRISCLNVLTSGKTSLLLGWQQASAVNSAERGLGSTQVIPQ